MEDVAGTAQQCDVLEVAVDNEQIGGAARASRIASAASPWALAPGTLCWRSARPTPDHRARDNHVRQGREAVLEVPPPDVLAQLDVDQQAQPTAERGEVHAGGETLARSSPSSASRQPLARMDGAAWR